MIDRYWSIALGSRRHFPRSLGMGKSLLFVSDCLCGRHFVVTPALAMRVEHHDGEFANYPQLAYSFCMKATFIELPPFARYRQDYLDDDAFSGLQKFLLGQPDAGDVIQGTGGLRKVRFADAKRGKGKRGGLRVIYYWWLGGGQFWLFTLYDKDEASDLSPDERKALKAMLEKEIEVRSQS
ncbi:MAG: hypothetical protein P4L87_20565 [Formivibrio sp.]|nr:hypothetical protein [Formivibrio sp.]